ncbi:hypothetical protein Poli38472_004720 [Pythium oligandrum]|uniref:Macro domain-containing protein n=1 Tax=Pythium oligandrum TaxID=41045 RepID=A0A8K1CB03_PYTOL|nr:hypothetical protein Poli38472_004720 [Pythium oligandrum]|eukprot:TMW59651.1 hypothetical protein Poli38472_004720 [Pythium oligandrum]
MGTLEVCHVLHAEEDEELRRVVMTARRAVLDIAEATRLLLLSLDFADIDNLLLVLQNDPSGRAVLHDSRLWIELTVIHFGARLPDDLASLPVPLKERTWNWTGPDVTCVELREFLRSGDEREHFRQHVELHRRNIAFMYHNKGKPFDALAYPTDELLSNRYTEAGGLIFYRAGRKLHEHLSQPEFKVRRNVGDIVTTPPFEAGGRLLFHCVIPDRHHPAWEKGLVTTFENLMTLVIAEDLKHLALALDQTGVLYPFEQRRGCPHYVLRALQKVIRTHHWDGTLAIVCNQAWVAEPFEAELEDVLNAFNVVSELP